MYHLLTTFLYSFFSQPCTTSQGGSYQSVYAARSPRVASDGVGLVNCWVRGHKLRVFGQFIRRFLPWAQNGLNSFYFFSIANNFILPSIRIITYFKFETNDILKNTCNNNKQQTILSFSIQNEHSRALPGCVDPARTRAHNIHAHLRISLSRSLSFVFFPHVT